MQQPISGIRSIDKLCSNSYASGDHTAQTCVIKENYFLERVNNIANHEKGVSVKLFYWKMFLRNLQAPLTTSRNTKVSDVVL